MLAEHTAPQSFRVALQACELTARPEILGEAADNLRPWSSTVAFWAAAG
jgi:hypothetical protein